MKKMKKIMAAAIAMMTFSTAAAVTGTVAWFTASNVVSASGMSIQADTEQGLLIANETYTSPSDWAASATASHNGEITVDSETKQAAFIPTSTFDASEWYHANSTNFDNAEANQASAKYAGFTFGDTTELGVNGSGTGVYQIKKGELAITNKNIFLLNSFFLKSSTIEKLIANKLYVNEVNTTAPETPASAALNKSLRVLVTCSYGNTLYKAFFAPFEASGELATYKVGGVEGQTYTPYESGKKDVELVTTALEIPGSNTTTPLEVKVYVYFEGEDANCKSANIQATLDKISLDVKFGTQKIVNN